jgi:hypothetical protein
VYINVNTNYPPTPQQLDQSIYVGLYLYIHNFNILKSLSFLPIFFHWNIGNDIFNILYTKKYDEKPCDRKRKFSGLFIWKICLYVVFGSLNNEILKYIQSKNLDDRLRQIYHLLCAFSNVGSFSMAYVQEPTVNKTNLVLNLCFRTKKYESHSLLRGIPIHKEPYSLHSIYRIWFLPLYHW